MLSIILLTVSILILFSIFSIPAEKTYDVLGVRMMVLLMILTIIATFYLIDTLLCYHLNIYN